RRLSAYESCTDQSASPNTLGRALSPVARRAPTIRPSADTAPTLTPSAGASTPARQLKHAVTERRTMAKKLRGQLFARLALDYFDHPKIAGLAAYAIVAHLEMLVSSRRYLTDGVIPMRVAMRYALHVVDELASNDPESPSVIRCDDGSLILHGYEDFQETRAEVEGRRRSAKDRAAARWSKDATSNARSNAVSTAHSNAETETETETYIRASQASAREPSRFP